MWNIQGSHYKDPEFIWKFAVAPAGIGFIHTDALGPDYKDTLFVGASRTFLSNGYIHAVQDECEPQAFCLHRPPVERPSG